MSYKQKAEFRDSPEWPAVARYYDEVNDVRHHNSSVMGYEIKMHGKPIGMMDYGDGTFIWPVCKTDYAPEWGPSYRHYRTGRQTKVGSIVVDKKK